MLSTFNEFLTEGTATFDGMRFTVKPVLDRAGLKIQFIPDGKTLDSATPAAMADRIKARLDQKMPMLSEAMYHVVDFPGAGIAFSINAYELSEIVSQSLK